MSKKPDKSCKPAAPAAPAAPAPEFDWTTLEAPLPPRPPQSITVTEYAQHYGIRRAQAAEMLNRLVAGGKLRRVEFHGVGGRRTASYVVAKVAR